MYLTTQIETASSEQLTAPVLADVDTAKLSAKIEQLADTLDRQDTVLPRRRGNVSVPDGSRPVTLR
jgi:hypothetical protein